MRQKAMEADIVIVNHHLFFADLNIRQEEVAAILPDYSAVIFDEAHELEDIATEYFGYHVSNYRVQELIYDIRKAIDRAEEATLSDEVNSVSRAADRFFNGFALVREGRHPLPELDGIEGLIGALQDLRRGLNKQRDRSGEWESLARRSIEIVDEL